MLIVVTCLAVLTALIGTAEPARPALASGDLTFTLNATDLGLDPALMQQLANKVNTQDTSLNSSLNARFRRQLEEYGTGNSLTSAWVNFDVTLTVTSAGMTLTIPGSEVQTTVAWYKTVIAAALGALIGLAVQTLCWSGLTATGVGAALIPLICVPAGSAMWGLAGTMISAAFAGTLGTPSFYATLAAATLAGLVGGFLWARFLQPWGEGALPTAFQNIANWLILQARVIGTIFGAGAAAAVNLVSQGWSTMSGVIGGVIRQLSTPAAGSLPCDQYGAAGTPCPAAYSTARALYSYYDGPLYQVQRASDNATADIGLLSQGGYVNASQQDSFCAGTTCTITRLYDQSPEWNDLTVEGAGGAAGADQGANATALPITVGGHEAYGIDFTGQIGYRDNNTQGIAVNGEPEGMYMVASGTNVNSGCCFDFGNAETNTRDNGNGHMDAVNLGTSCTAPCTGSGPWVQADMENGLFMGGNGSNLANAGNNSNFVTALLKNDGQKTYALKGGNAQSGGLSTWWHGSLPTSGGYMPMQQEGAIVLGTGGDNSNWDVGSFFEGVMTQGYPSDAADDAVQASIVSAGYSGNSGGAGGSGSGVTPSAAGAAVVHSAGATGAGASGFSSVYTVDSANQHLQESYLPYMGATWSTQDLSAEFGTPPVMPGTQPVALVHCGFTSVYTVDASNGDLQETFLSAIGSNWSTQDLSANYGTPPTDETPTAVLHTAGASGASPGCGYTSVYTVDRNGDLQETYLPNAGFPGDPWITKDLSVSNGTPRAQPGTSPVAIVHCGYTSVYTVDGGSHDLQETFLSTIGSAWYTQNLSANYGTPPTDTTPTAVVHAAGAAGASPGCGYTSVYTVDQSNRHLQETYLPNTGFPGDPWHTQDLSANYGTPAAAPGTAPVALVHTNYTSVYTVDQGSDQLQETYLPAIGDSWSTQSLSANYGTPTTDQTPIVLLHPDASGNLDWTSVYTINEFNNDLQETFLPAIGNSWTTKDLSASNGTPTVAVQQSSESSWSVAHLGYTSVYTVDASNGDLQETYLTAMGASWSTQDLSANYGTPTVEPGVAPVAVVHDGYTSVFTVDKSSGDLQETYLPSTGFPGDKWITHDLSASYGTPQVKAGTTPTAVFHDGYTSVYTIDTNGDLQETYLPAAGFPGDPWVTTDLSASSGTPQVKAGTSPVAILHDGYTSVYTVDASNSDLQETYLPVMDGPWNTQNLSANYGTPQTNVSPAAVFHDGYTSVYTVDASNGDLQETYLPAIADPWVTKDLSAGSGTPKVKSGMAPVALYHTGATSVYTLDASNGDLQETYLGAINDAWVTQDLSASSGTPVPNQPPSPLVHYAANGGLTWTSLYTVDTSNLHLQETFLPAIGNSWTTKDLSAGNGTPPV